MPDTGTRTDRRLSNPISFNQIRPQQRQLSRGNLVWIERKSAGSCNAHRAGQVRTRMTPYRKPCFDCPNNFSPITDGTNAPPNVSVPYLCRASGPFPSITGRLKQVASCPTNSQPCHPLQPMKSAPEIDFEFAGKAICPLLPFLKASRRQNRFPCWLDAAYSERRIDSSWINIFRRLLRIFDILGNDRYQSRQLQRSVSLESH